MAQFNPNKKAQMAHVINLLAIASLDDKITEEEKQLVFSIANQFGLNEDEFDLCLSKAVEGKNEGKVVIEVPKTDEDKTFYLKNLTTMMMIDGQIDDAEKQYIKFVAEKFGYDGDKALDILINSVYDDFCKTSGDTKETASNGASTKETGKSVDDMTDEEFKAENQRLIALGKQALVDHEIGKAFDYLILPAHIDREGMNLFLMIINTFTRLYLLSDEQIARLKFYAEKGYVLSQYAYARYLYIVRPDNDSVKEADKYFKEAEKAGLGDAIQAQSTIMLDGHYGLVDYEEAHQMTVRAVEKGSELAARAYLRRIVYGNSYIGMESDPQRAIDIIKQMFENESDDISEVNPMYYEILGDAYEKLGDKENAEKYYMKAIEMGYVEAYGSYCMLHNENNTTDLLKGMYETMLEMGCSQGDPYSYVYKAAFHMDEYDNYDEAKQKEITAEIREDLETASKLGSQIAPYFLGDAYYYGNYGFEQDNTKAWDWFIEGSRRDESGSYKMLAIMISNEDNPYEITEREKMMEYCSIMSLRDGGDDMLDIVVNGYRDGNFTDYAAEIEKYYIPDYDSRPHDDDEDDESDEDEDFEDDGDYKLIAIVKTDGKADIIEFDVEEGWDEMPEFVGANRLDAIRTQPLYDVSKQVGYTTDHVTGWVDNMGLMKDLMMNSIGRQLYPGPIAGDMILTLEDAKYNPKSFESLSRLKKVLAALGAELEHVNLDDGPDDDGRYDAWS